MEKATIIGIDLAKRVFQVHGAAQDGRPVFRKKAANPASHLIQLAITPDNEDQNQHRNDNGGA